MSRKKKRAAFSRLAKIPPLESGIEETEVTLPSYVA